MEKKTESNLLISANGKPVGRVNTIYSMTCEIDGPLPEWLQNLQSEDARRKELEAIWLQLPEPTRKTAQESARLLGSLLYRLGAHSLSVDVMAEGNPHTLTITLNKKTHG